MTEANALKQLPKTSSRWALVPVGLLVSSVIGCSWMAWVAARDPNFALERDYYQKAIHWDQTQAQAATNQRLAYRFNLPARIGLDSSGRATIEVRLMDRSGQPIAGAHVVADAFPNAFSDEIATLKFEERAPGVYSAQLTSQRSGVWELRLAADLGGDHATAIARCELRRGTA
jgi:nitrogen fixation protein FixH